MADRANWDLKAHFSENAHFSDNSLIFNQTPDLASAYNLSADNIGMQNPISDNRTFGVTDSYLQTLRGSNTDSQNLHNSIRGAHKRVS
ncbi:hypothetical protein PSI22_01240 [Xenorhabdus sp. XENO-7]|uniref:Uncharacterized protein n=1 Tax=Xenorhabdus aichiensis TaxID=3025874 RepID=A0ABT5LXX0_9GAMM|nr:hypothetical protein [Xenorhabdus aichiensis]MDC9620288.1 hypothetical protein [Xenorhabdus aichiensis]